ncbi:hypothetical protein ACFH04_17015 [Streptomyces noboritoensis]|uniref:NACHT domain-containing protein n=1 Tax=Streptomyces noboritoensis TaxID=67337 RepID=A0ABV6THX7_9ACTN
MVGRERLSARSTGQARAEGPATVANSGVINGNVTVSEAASPRVPRSGYLLQVAAIAPAELRGRELELTAMTRFCTEPGTDTESHAEAGTTPCPVAGTARGPYWRWLAPAWAGKSALMAHFVLHPPPGVDIVAFFVTARLARQNDRQAFCEVVQRQLYALLGEEEPLTTDCTREEQLLLALDRAAQSCARRQRRLVLLVDGLDEDRGVTAGADSHSIGALLPRRPPHGMRVLVAGRPHPPVPDDVPADHPLRDTGIDHALGPSPHAQAVRVDAERDLLRLLEEGGSGRDLVGLIAAAGGGLGAADLARLTGSRPRLVERELTAVSGRSFRVRAAHWPGAEGAYLLAHEEIQRSALNLLSEGELAEFRGRLHVWAEEYRDLGWPDGTPEYLLRGYVQLLRDRRDTARLTALARDPARHERLWRVSGSDLEALTEIAFAFDLLLLDDNGETGGPDVDTAVLLAFRRDALHDRMDHLPSSLIALWARLGHVERAVNLARAQGPVSRDVALAEVAGTLAETGVTEPAIELARSNPSDYLRDEALKRIVRELVSTGRHDRAVDLARTIGEADQRAKVLATVAAGFAGAGRHGHAVALARQVEELAATIGPLHARAEVLGAVGAALASAGLPQEADESVRQATGFARYWTGYGRAQILAAVASALATAGHRARAAEVAREAADFTRTLTDPIQRRWATPAVARALAEAALPEQSVGLALGIDDEDDREELLADLAGVLARKGHREQALEVAGGLVDPYERTRALASVSEASAAPDRRDRAAEAILEAAREAAELVTHPVLRIRALALVANALAAAGLHAEATEAAHLVTDLARGGFEPPVRVTVLAALAEALAAAGGLDQAAGLARRAAERTHHDTPLGRARDLAAVGKAFLAVGRERHATDAFRQATDAALHLVGPSERCEALCNVAEAWARAGRPGRAISLTRRARELADATDSPHDRAWSLASVASVLALAGRYDESVDLAHTLADAHVADQTLSTIAEALAGAGRFDRAEELADDVEELVEYERILGHTAGALAAAGRHDRALSLVDGLTKPIMRDIALPTIVGALAAAGQPLRAVDLAGTIRAEDHRGLALAAVAQALGPTAQARRHLVEALRLIRWDKVLAAISSVAPWNLEVVAALSVHTGAGYRPEDRVTPRHEGADPQPRPRAPLATAAAPDATTAPSST